MAAFVQDANDLADFHSLLGECSTEVDALVSRCALEYNELVSACSASVAAIRNKVEDARQELIDRQRDLEAAELSLSSAEASLSACNSQPADDDGTPPDCSSEENALCQAQQNLAAAQAGVDAARQLLSLRLRALDQSENLLAHAKAEADDAKSSLERSHLTFATGAESAKQFLRNSTLRLGEYSSSSAPPVQSAVGSIVSSGRRVSVLVHETNQKIMLPDLTDFGAQAFPTSGIANPSDLKRRFQLSPSSLGAFADELMNRDTRFSEEIQRRRRDYSEASGPADRALVMAQMMRSTSGLFGERLVLAGLGPLGSKIVAQERTTTPDGDCTITDAVVYDVKVPVILGRGKGLFVPAGGTLRCEVKARRAGSLPGEKDHLHNQVRGGDPAHRRLVIVTRDIRDLDEDEASKIRQVVRDAGAQTLALLPRKEDLDAILWELITRPTRTK